MCDRELAWECYALRKIGMTRDDLARAGVGEFLFHADRDTRIGQIHSGDVRVIQPKTAGKEWQPGDHAVSRLKGGTGVTYEWAHGIFVGQVCGPERGDLVLEWDGRRVRARGFAGPGAAGYRLPYRDEARERAVRNAVDAWLLGVYDGSRGSFAAMCKFT